MHTAQIASLPVQPTPAGARHESRGDDFAVHLDKEARELSRHDEPRSTRRNEPIPAEARPRDPEDDYQRISSDDGATAMVQSESIETPAASQSETELPDSGTETSDAAGALDQTNAPAQPTIAGPSTPQTPIAELGGSVIDTAIPATSAIQISDSPPPAEPVTAPAIDGVLEVSATTPVPETTPIDSAPDSLLAEVPKTAAAIATSATASPAAGTPGAAMANDHSSQTLSPSTGATPTAAMPAVVDMAGHAAAAPTVATGGLRINSGAPGQAATVEASADGSGIEPLQTDGAEGDAEIMPGSSSRTVGIIPAAAPTGQSVSATAEHIASTPTGTADISAVQDIAARGNEQAGQSGISNPVHNNTSAFGTDLKLVGDASPATETAAARNTPNPVASQVAVQISRAVLDAQDKFIVNLKPATLGNISIQLEVGHDNRVIAVIAAERPETLELLQRDSRALELALKDAGLKADSGSLSFSLQGDGNENAPFDNPSELNHAVAVSPDGDDLETLPTQTASAYAANASGVDIHA